MKPPFSITIEATSLAESYRIICYVLRAFPSLRITTAEHETAPVTASPSQTDSTDAHIRAYVAACICSIYPRADPSRFRDAIDKAHSNFVRLDSDSNAERTRIEAHIAATSASRTASEHAADEALRQADAIHRENIAECSAAKKERDRGDNNADRKDDYPSSEQPPYSQS